MKPVFLGIDVGSTSVKVVTLDATGEMLAHRYLRSNGRPRETVLDAIASLGHVGNGDTLRAVSLTGSGGRPVADLIGGHHVNELVAQTRSVGRHYPHARTVIELGGQDSKFLSVRWEDKTQQMALVDFAMNALCAAGTGSFLDQQAERLGIAIDREFAEIALQSDTPARIAGRCTVFAKSDMIHLQQRGTPLPDILAGLCMALARNFRSVIGRGKAFTPPILFQGGVAYNLAVARAFRDVLGLTPEQLIIPEHHEIMVALGAAYLAMDDAATDRVVPFRGFEPLREATRTGRADSRGLEPLIAKGHGAASVSVPPLPSAGLTPVHLGIDVGSISTNLVLLDESRRVVARRYLLTAGRPLEAVRQGLTEIGGEVGDRVVVRSVGVTGSGRYLTGDFVGADVVRNEITAQARAAIEIDPDVDTIIEIGGQDSKYIRVQDGAVVDFAMNNACAAGTGSFLEEQAERLKIDIAADFAPLAFCSGCPSALGERCTVFMESDLVHHQQRGARVEDLTAGLAYSIAENYLNRVSNGRPLGRRIFFQGGVAWNRAVVIAFEQLTKRPITVPPHHDVTGAIGAAILAADSGIAETRFRGFDVTDRQYESHVFECKACPNLCQVNRVTIGGEPPIFHGARCDKFEEAGRAHGGLDAGVPDLFAERERLLMAGFQPPKPRNGRVRVAMPRSLIFYDLFPFWRAFFEELGVDLVLSDATTPRTIGLTQERATSETCFPIKLAYGHVAELVAMDVDYVFLPSIMDRENIAPGQRHNHYCPFISAAPHLVSSALGLRSNGGPQPIMFALHLRSEYARVRQLRALGRRLGASKRDTDAAARAAEQAQNAFYAGMRDRGREILDSLESLPPAVVIIGRPYNTCDLGACQDLPGKIRKLGVLPIPMDFLPVEGVDVSARYSNMFWRCGQDILAAGTIIANEPRLHAVYLTNFNCGPDSFIGSFLRRVMAGKPFLELEVDDHTADAGIITRCEAFFDSLNLRSGATGSTVRQ